MRNRNESSSTDRVHLWVSVGLCLILLGVAFFATRMVADLTQAEDLRARSYRRLTASTQVFSLLKDAEASQRGYLITGKEEYLQPYHTAREQLGQRFAELRELTSSDSEQTERTKALETIATTRLKELDEDIVVRRLRGSGAAAALVDSDRGEKPMETIRSLAVAMERAELETLELRAAEASRQRSRWLAALWCLTAIACAGTVAAGWQRHRDVRRWRRAERDLRFAAGHDALTGLCNRREFDLALSHAVARCRKTRAPFALASVDVDRFKHVNDTLGHQAGDKVLRALALRLRDGFRDGDLIARMGGEEFAAILYGLDGPGAWQVAERVRARIAAQPITLTGADKGRLAPVTVSIGLSVFPRDGITKLALMHAADRALYAAKRLGRNRVNMADEEPNTTRNPIS